MRGTLVASSIRRHLDGVLKGSFHETRKALLGLDDNMQLILAHLGLNTGLQDTPGAQAPNVPIPSPAQFTVTGVDGHYVIAITNPQNIQPLTAAVLQQNAQANLNAIGGAIYHQLQSATSVNFDANSSVSAYGPSTATSLDITDANQQKFWRLRSSYDQSNWNAWQIFSSAAVCGPIAVWSGLLKNSSSALVDSATTPEGTSPLSQDGTTTNIKVAASIWKDGDQVINYNLGHVDPGSFGTWLIYATDQFRVGGTVTFVATTESSDITASLYHVYFGKITTSGGGGGTGSGGGGGTCCRAGVPYRRFDGTDQDCSTLNVGDDLLAIDGGKEIIQQIDIIPERPCFRMEFDASGKLTAKTYIGDFTVYRIRLDRSHTFLAGSSGVIDGACSEHIIQYAGGGFTDVFGAVVSEVFSLQNGACGSHNFNKL